MVQMRVLGIEGEVGGGGEGEGEGEVFRTGRVYLIKVGKVEEEDSQGFPKGIKSVSFGADGVVTGEQLL